MFKVINRFKGYLIFAILIAILISLGFYIGKQEIQHIIPWALSGILFVLWRKESGSSATKKPKKIRRLK